MTAFSFSYLSYLTQRHPSYANTRTLWEAAGGNISEIEDQGSGMDRWTHLLRIAEHGAVRPVDLTLAALQRDPHNAILLADLESRLPQDLRLRAKSAVQQVLDAPQSTAAQQALVALGDLNDPEVVAATVLATEQEARQRPGTYEVVLEIAKSVAGEVAKVGLTLMAASMGLPGFGQ